jgi:hypothetical protein
MEVMTSLTQMISVAGSPVAQWLRATFPNTRPVLAEMRAGAGVPSILPAERIAYPTQGAAVDWWLRFLAEPDGLPDLSLAHAGLEALRGLPAFDAGWPLLATTAGLGPRDWPDHPATAAGGLLRDFDDQFQARACFALALLTECYRAGVRPGSRLLTLPEGAGPQALLDLATTVEVADLIAMRDSAREVFLPHLPAGPVHTGPTFDGSRLLPADADLIAGDCLIECKATIGGPPRKDGTRALKFDRDDLYQLLGYVLMDFSDAYAIRRVGLYAPRFASFQTWPLAQVLDAAAGKSVDLPQARGEFEQVLRTDLPPFLAETYGIR